jgi:hypothetical protein
MRRYDLSLDFELGPRVANELWAEDLIEISALLHSRVSGSRFVCEWGDTL